MLVLDSNAEIFQGAVASCATLSSHCLLLAPKLAEAEAQQQGWNPHWSKDTPDGNRQRSLPSTVTVSTKVHIVWRKLPCWGERASETQSSVMELCA